MSLRNIMVVYRKEVTEWLRDRRTLISTVLIPLLLFPLLMVGFSSLAVFMVGKAQQETPTVMILGGQDSPQILEKLHSFDKIDIVPLATDWKSEISGKLIRAAVEIPKGFQASLASSHPETVTIYYYEGDLKSSFGASRLKDFFKDYSDSIVSSRLAAHSLPDSLLKPFDIKQQNVASAEQVSGATLGGLVGYMVILLCMTGAMYPAIDLTAGEKERGTMETILSSPISRTDLVLGKFALVLSASLTTAILAVFSMGVSFSAVGRSHILKASDAAQMQLKIGLDAAATVFLMALPVAILFAAVLLTIALFAKSHKEAQSYVTPMTFLVIIPAVASLMPGVELTPKLALVPILNTSLVCKEIISGIYHWNYIAIIFVSTCAYAAFALFLAIKMFQRESVLFRS
jgi:sodium transport system permease protein